MGKAAPDATIDGLLDVIAGSTILHVCSGEPANYAGIAAVSLADVVVDSGDFTKANGDTSGRKVTVGAQTAFTVDNTGTATHIALAVSGTSTLTYVTTCTSQALVAANTVSTPAWKVEVLDPS